MKWLLWKRKGGRVMCARHDVHRECACQLHHHHVCVPTYVGQLALIFVL